MFGRKKIERKILNFYLKGFIYPSLHSIWSKWAPKNDKSKLATFAFSGREKFETKKKVFIFFFKGSYIGTLITMMFGGIIAAYWSWEWIFYLSGRFI